MTKSDVTRLMHENNLDAIMLGHTFRRFIDHRLEASYLTGYNFVDDTFMLYTAEGTPIIFSWPAEIAELEHKVKDAVFIDTYKQKFDKKLILNTLKEHGIKKLAALGWWSPFALKLQKDIDVVTIDNIVTIARATKDEKELEKIKDVQKKSEILIEEVITKIIFPPHNKPLTVGRIKRSVLDSAYGRDLYWPFPEMFVLNSGEKTIEGHNMGAKSDKIQTNSSIIIDMVPKGVNGYCGNITRTVIKKADKTDERTKKILKAYESVLKMTVDLLDGKMDEMGSYGELSTYFTRRFVRPRKDSWERSCAYGHGIGMEFHEFPWIDKQFGEFENGHVFTTEPGLSNYLIKAAVRIGNMWVVENGKPRIVSNHSKEKLIEHLERLEI